MAKDTITVTTSWVQIATGPVTITVTKRGTGTLWFNESGADANASKYSPDLGEQFVQDDSVDTFVKMSGAGWILLVDGTL